MHPTFLPPALEVERIAETDSSLTIHTHSTSTQAICPACGQPSRSPHSTYPRAPTDTPIGERSVKLRLRVRRYRCRNPACSKVTFAERFPSLLNPNAQRTTRARHAQASVAIALGGEPGARLLDQLHATVSADTLLRSVRAHPLPQIGTPSVLGVDDFSFKRGKTFGTILIDLEQHRVLDVLEDRNAISFATWLKAQPGVEIISRDRSPIYAQGASDGAPSAVQVADRWHLLKNLGDAVRDWLERHRKHLKVPLDPAQTAVDDKPAGNPAHPEAHNTYEQIELERVQRYARRLEQYEAIVKLKDDGYSERAIARRVGGIGRSAVGRWLIEGKPLEYKRYPRTGHGKLVAFKPYLKSRLDDHDANTKQIFAELVARGFTGSNLSVYRFAALYRAGLKADTPASQVRIPPDAVRYSAREGVWMFLRDPDKLNPEELARLEHLRVTVPESNIVLDLVRRFRALVRARPTDAERTLLTWLAEAHACGVLEIDRFAKGVRGDLAAVVAGLRLAWSNGQTEGQVTRLKLIKRSMYGRAKFDLLRARVLLA